MANHTERKGVHHCGEIAEEYQWMFREQPVNDIGIDAHMEFTDPYGAAKQLLALQLVRAILKKKKTTVLFSEILMKDNIIIGQQILCLVLLFYIIMTPITKFAFGKS